MASEKYGDGGDEHREERDRGNKELSALHPLNYLLSVLGDNACCACTKQFLCGRSLMSICSRPLRESICCQPARPPRSRARGSPRGRPSLEFCLVGVGRSTACASRPDSPAPPRRTPSPSGTGGCSARSRR